MTDTNNAAELIYNLAMRLGLSPEPTDCKLTLPRVWSSAGAIEPKDLYDELRA
jgi:hypothetical protein